MNCVSKYSPNAWTAGERHATSRRFPKSERYGASRRFPWKTYWRAPLCCLCVLALLPITVCHGQQTISNGRLVVTIPKSKFTNYERLAFDLAEDAKIVVHSDDYRRASAGDEVVSLLAARFSTGDSAIKEIAIRLATDADASAESPTTVPNQYRRLSDAPSPPRDLRSPHFLLHTDISDRSGRMLLDKLETMIALVSQYYGQPPTKVTECYVVRDLQLWPSGVLPANAIMKIQEPAGVTLSVSVGSVTKSVVYSCDPNYSGRSRALGIGMMSGQPGASFESVYGPVGREVSFEYDFFVQHLDNGFRCDLCAWQWNRKFQFLLPKGNVSTKVLAKYGWQASNVKLRAGESYDCAAKDTWKTSQDGDDTDANGDTDGQGRLVGVIMTDDRLGEPFASEARP